MVLDAITTSIQGPTRVDIEPIQNDSLCIPYLRGFTLMHLKPYFGGTEERHQTVQ